jgi:hypothetical protein
MLLIMGYIYRKIWMGGLACEDWLSLLFFANNPTYYSQYIHKLELGRGGTFEFLGPSLVQKLINCQPTG